jgi:hypothetical protein
MRIASALACVILYTPFFVADLVFCWRQVRRRRGGMSLSAWPLVAPLLYCAMLLPLKTFELQVKWIAIAIVVPVHLIATQRVPQMFPSRTQSQPQALLVAGSPKASV